jgi:hypothetical protein
MMAPGTRALAFASRWFDPAVVHRTFEPLIADWQREWYESGPSRRAWVSIRGFAAFACAAAISTPAVVATPIPRAVTFSVAKRIAGFCFVVGGALSIPMVRSMGSREMDPPLWAALLLMALPAGIAIAFPFAMVIAVDAIRRHADVAPHVARAAALKLGVVAMCIMLTLNGVVGPYASREFMRVVTPAGWNVPQPRFTQLSTAALLTHPERSTAMVASPEYTRAGQIRRELLQRAVMGVMPLMFVWLRWTALNQPRRRRSWPLPGWAMTAAVVAVFFTTFFAGFRLEMEWSLMPGTGLLLPLFVFGLWCLAEQRFAQRGAPAT